MKDVDIDTEQPLEGGMSVQMWLSHADEFQPQVDLQRTIWDELRRELEPEIQGINVEVEDSVATLTGRVPSYPVKLRVHRAAERVLGIVAVIDEIAVEG